MIDRDDLRAATAAGILTEPQAASLIALADRRRGARAEADRGDEAFELFRGFNEIFIVVGLVILFTGWTGVIRLLFGLGSTGNLAGGLLGAALVWLLSRYFVERRRMVAPAIALSVMFALNAFLTFGLAFAEPFMVAQRDYASLPWPAVLTTLAVLLYWVRFRVPFALAIVAVCLFGIAILLAAIARGTPATFSEMFQLSADGPFAWVTLLLGLAVFAVAMRFDMSDPHRVTRRAANGFWLHVVAAPALVNTLALSLLDRGGLTNLLLLAILALIAVVAVIIDRRSFLIAAIGYILLLTGTLFGWSGSAFLVMIFGAALLLLGAFWDRIRALLIAPLPDGLRRRLPPSGPHG